MALTTHVGNFTQPTTTNASFAVTGVGFTPKALILFSSDQTAVGISTNFTIYQGMATSTSNRVGLSSSMLTSSATVGSRAHNDTKCFVVYNTSGTLIVAADLVSFDSDGFTLNFSTVDAVARKIGYIALGGSDLTNAFIKEFVGTANSNVDQSFTGVGFKPDAMILMSAGVGGVPPAADTGGISDPLWGFATASTQEGMTANVGATTESTQLAKIIQKTSGTGVLTMAATLKTFDSDGFTLTFSASSSQKYCYALCLKGGQYAVGVYNQPGSTGNHADVTGLAFQPVGVILGSFNHVTSASVITTQARVSFGAASSSSARASIWSAGSNGGIMDNDWDSGKIINMITEGASPTTNASADFVSFDSGGFTNNWTTTDATAREIVYFAFGSNAIVGYQVTRMMMGFGF